MNINLSLLSQPTNEQSASRTPCGTSALESETAMPPPVFDSSSGKRAKGKTPFAEKLLVELESFATYDKNNGGFVITKCRNSRNPVGSPAVQTMKDPARYKYISLKIMTKKYFRYPEHHLVWLWHTGELPSDEIDHIDQDCNNNRIQNLRLVSRGINAKNLKKRNDNTSGYVGVYWHKAMAKWADYVTVNGHRKYLGYFDTPEEAFAHRCKVIAAHPEWGFTDKHIYA